MSAVPVIDPELVDQAIAWSVRLRLHAADPVQRQACQAWRSADARHEAAWQRIESMQQALANVPPTLAGQVLAARAGEASARKGRRNALKLLLAGAAVGATAYAGRDSAWMQQALADYSTGVGQRRQVRLDDGTELLLNTGTSVNVRYEAGRRLVEVRRGEVMITTGRDEASLQHRPFVAGTSDGTMLAMGTRFLVRKEDERTRLTVLEHAVELESAGGAAAPVLAHAGDSYYMSRAAVWRADVAEFDPGAWTEGLIAAREMRMDRFLAELSRYRPGLLRCDPAVADLPVSGIFQLADTDRTLEVLLATQPVAALYRTRWWVTIIPRRPQ
ncbi:FecR domain-containing protein [Herbaspirillum robiniae]|uniref:FecR domain-containing protein n=1 Tax=Herbaspirillum robiniae TaxID=2014887 RepID=UPI003D76F4A2